MRRLLFLFRSERQHGTKKTGKSRERESRKEIRGACPFVKCSTFVDTWPRESFGGNHDGTAQF